MNHFNECVLSLEAMDAWERRFQPGAHFQPDQAPIFLSGPPFCLTRHFLNSTMYLLKFLRLCKVNPHCRNLTNKIVIHEHFHV